MSSLTPAQEALRALAEKATPGEWRVRGFVNAPATDRYPELKRCRLSIQSASLGSLSQDDAHFIAAANPAAVLALLDELAGRARRRAAEDACRVVRQRAA